MTELVNDAIANAEPIGWTAIILSVIGLITRWLELRKYKKKR